MKNIVITIDGPAASGKEKISKYISKKWKLKHLDSGILYRRLAQIFLNEKINIKNVLQIKNRISKIDTLSFHKSSKIRSQKISNLASEIAVHSFVRLFMAPLNI